MGFLSTSASPKRMKTTQKLARNWRGLREVLCGLPQTTMAATASIMKWPANIARRVSNPLQAASKLARYRDAARRLIRSRGRSNVFGLQP
jgi:hypothetical protein